MKILLGYDFLLACYQSFIMISIPSLIAILFGLPIGSILYLCQKNGYKENRVLYSLATFYVNTVRSFPYIIFVILLLPFTRFIVGTGIGLKAALIPLSFVGTALFARFIEQAFTDIPISIIDLAKSYKVNSFNLVRYFLIVESRQSIALGLTSTIISIISYSTVMGLVGAGGVGEYAMTNGYLLLNYDLIYQVVFVILIFVYAIQFTGNYISKLLDKKRRDEK